MKTLKVSGVDIYGHTIKICITCNCVSNIHLHFDIIAFLSYSVVGEINVRNESVRFWTKTEQSGFFFSIHSLNLLSVF